MVYGGSSQVEAGGATVDVPRGMGTVVPEGGAPSPPEKLLPAPATSSPGRRERFGYSNPRFVWRPVSGAATYTVEVCLDPRCGRLVARETGMAQTNWQPERLPVGELYWRVTAVSASGLDGYASRALPLTVTSPAPDLEPPVVVAALAGAGHMADDGAFVLGRGAAIRLEGRDDASGIAEVRYRWGESSWRLWRGRDLALPDGLAEARLEIEATDRLGRKGEPWSVPVTRGESPPQAPAVRAVSRSAQDPP